MGMRVIDDEDSSSKGKKTVLLAGAPEGGRSAPPRPEPEPYVWLKRPDLEKAMAAKEALLATAPPSPGRSGRSPRRGDEEPKSPKRTKDDGSESKSPKSAKRPKDDEEPKSPK